MTSFGDKGLPVFHAGHWSWQRPHSVQLRRSRSCFQLKCVISPAPKTSSSDSSSGSMFGVVARAPRAMGRREKRTLGSDTKMWRCFEYMTTTRKIAMTPICASTKVVSRAWSTPWLSPDKALPTRCDANAQSLYGK